MKVGIVDYRMGNLASVSKAIEHAGAKAVVSDRIDQLDDSDLLILPGVGHFGAGMDNLAELGLTEFIIDWAAAGKHLLGVCVGMQLLFEESDEGGARGLGILKGRVEQFDPGLKVPHMGWNTLQQQGDSPVFGEFDGRYFYFVHSYYCVPSDERVTAATTGYGVEFASAVHDDNVYGVQFHPEKSSDDGLALYARLLKAVA